MKKILAVIICLLCIPFSVSASNECVRSEENNYGVNKNITLTSDRISIAQRTPCVDSKEKIYDYADLFNEKEEDELLSLVNDFIKYYAMDFAVVTIDENPYQYSSDYSYNKDEYSMKFADDFYDYNDFGVGEDYSGVLFLIDMSNRYIWISSTGEAMKYYNSSNVYTLLDYSISNFTGGNYYEGLKDTIYIMSEEIDSGLDKHQGKKYWTSRDTKKLSGFAVTSLTISGIVTLIFFLVNMGKCKTAVKATKADSYTTVNQINVVNDILVNRSHTSHVIQSSSGGGGGGHSGSSGISHSGGGHHF